MKPVDVDKEEVHQNYSYEQKHAEDNEEPYSEILVLFMLFHLFLWVTFRLFASNIDHVHKSHENKDDTIEYDLENPDIMMNSSLIQVILWFG